MHENNNVTVVDCYHPLCCTSFFFFFPRIWTLFAERFSVFQWQKNFVKAFLMMSSSPILKVTTPPHPLLWWCHIYSILVDYRVNLIYMHYCDLWSCEHGITRYIHTYSVISDLSIKLLLTTLNSTCAHFSTVLQQKQNTISFSVSPAGTRGLIAQPCECPGGRNPELSAGSVASCESFTRPLILSTQNAFVIQASASVCQMHFNLIHRAYPTCTS